MRDLTVAVVIAPVAYTLLVKSYQDIYKLSFFYLYTSTKLFLTAFFQFRFFFCSVHDSQEAGAYQENGYTLTSDITLLAINSVLHTNE